MRQPAQPWFDPAQRILELATQLEALRAEIGDAWEALPDGISADTLAGAIREAMGSCVKVYAATESDTTPAPFSEISFNGVDWHQAGNILPTVPTPDPLFGETLIPHSAAAREWRDGYRAGIWAERQQQSEEIEHLLSVADDMLPVASGEVRRGYVAALTDLRDAYDRRELHIERAIDGVDEPAGGDA